MVRIGRKTIYYIISVANFLLTKGELFQSSFSLVYKTQLWISPSSPYNTCLRILESAIRVKCSSYLGRLVSGIFLCQEFYLTISCLKLCRNSSRGTLSEFFLDLNIFRTNQSKITFTIALNVVLWISPVAIVIIVTQGLNCSHICQGPSVASRDFSNLSQLIGCLISRIINQTVG